MAFDPLAISTPGARIKVIGVGGGGTNAVSTMIRSNIEGVEFIAANTDVQSLRFALASHKIQIGKDLTRGLGAGADPDVGRDAALEDRHELQEALSGSDMVFITAGMGGGTGTGGAAVVSQIARECGALTVGVVTKPFNFEGKRRRKHADLGIARLREHVDTLIVIPNERLLKIATPDLSMLDAFKMADNVLVNAVRGISDIINVPGTINVDFADVKTVMASMGQALMGIGTARGEKRAVEAAKIAISSPLLEDIDIEGATGILINITAGENITLMEINEACSIIQEAAHEDANIIFGAVIDENLTDEIRVTVIATGFPSEAEEEFYLKEKSSSYRPKNVQKPQRQTASYLQSFEQKFDQSKDDSFNSILADSKQSKNQKENRNEFVSSKPVEKGPEKKIGAPLDSEELTRWTISSIEKEPHVDASIARELARSEPSISLGFENKGEKKKEQGGSDSSIDFQTDFAFDSNAINSDIDSSEVASNRSQGLRQNPSEPSTDSQSSFYSPFFLDNANGINDEIDKKIDEALELAERIKKVPTEEDDLDIPAFLRNSVKDLPLT